MKDVTRSLRHYELNWNATSTVVSKSILHVPFSLIRYFWPLAGRTDPDEVELEYPTVDGKSVDYAMKINRKPVFLLEGKTTYRSS